MTNTNEQKQDAQPKQATNPDMIAYTVQERENGKKSIWTPIGAAWAHKDGKGYNIDCSALPVDGKLTLRFRSNATDNQGEVEQGSTPQPQ